MNQRILWPVLAVLLVGLVAIFYPRRAMEPPPVPMMLPEPATDVAPGLGPDPEPEPPPVFLDEDAPDPPPPLPGLDDSDAEARAALAEAAGAELVEQYLVEDSLVRKLVATVDNLGGEAIWVKTRVVPPREGLFLVEGSGDELRISPKNYRRYAAFVQLVEAVDTARLAAAYQRHYPLLQQAYEELGYPGRQFHNRALEIIDHLLDTPVVEGPIRLVQPHVLYKYADPELEALSSGQKMLLRTGPENAAILRNKLRELRTELEALSRAPRTDASN
jgi:hypothetical protein